MTNAPAPSRASLNFSLSLGLLNIPVNGYTATEDITVKRAQYLADGTKVGSAPCVKNDDGSYGDKVSRDEIVKRFQTENGLIDLSDDEIDSVISAVPGVAEILAVLDFVHLDSGEYVPNGKVWQIRAAKLGSGRAAKPNPGGERAFALLLAALEAEEGFALIRFSRAGTVYLGALLPTGRLVGLYHDDEVREERPIPAQDAVSADEVALARTLLQGVRQGERFAVVNDSVAKVTAYAEAKAAGTVTSTPVKVDNTAAAIDLFATLKASVEAAQKVKANA